MADLTDPLEGYTGLSLFSRTFASFPNLPQSLDSVNNRRFKSLPVQNPDKLREQTESILATAAEARDTKTTNNAASENIDNFAAENAVKYPRGQRPGLGRKRPRFSLLPNISQPTVNLEPTLDFDKYKNPEDFFSAYDRLENAKKEIAKQTGRAFTDSDQYNVFKVPRSQRPGIPGRATAKYKHLYPTMTSQSQEMSKEDILSNCGSQQESTQPDVASQEEPVSASAEELELTNDALQQTELATEEMKSNGSVAKTENRVNELLEELLTNDFEELDEDETANLLQERLSIKHLHIDKLNLPELQAVQRVDFKASGANLQKHRHALLDIHNLLKAPRNATPLKKNIENSVSSFGSPTPPKSPLASLSLLKKRLFRPNPSSDPFSAVDMEHSPAKNTTTAGNSNTFSDPVEVENTLPISGVLDSVTSEENGVAVVTRGSAVDMEYLPAKNAPAGNSNKFSDPVEVENTFPISGVLDSVTSEENDGADVTRNSTEVAIEDFTSSHEKQANENLSNPVSASESSPRESDPVSENYNGVMCDEVINEKSCAGVDMDVQTIETDDLDVMEDVQQEAIASVLPNILSVQSNNASDGEQTVDADNGVQDDAPEQNKETDPEQQNEKIQEPTVTSKKKQSKAKLGSKKRRDNKSISKRKRPADPEILEDQPMDLCPEHQENALDQTQAPPSEQNNEESSVASMDERTIANSRPSKENKRTTRPRANSLAGFGMSCETGVRRSTRIRSRPLEFWKGERFLYGRIHGSLATIIGIKYESPGKEKGGPAMKVKSFVSDEYKELLDQAALY